MKILRLKVSGFGPYKSEQSVDFEAFDDDGIFLITGKTGAGKSSILDAICYALYGSVPRYDGAQARLRSDHAGPDDPTSVELEFRVGNAEYRVRRSPEFARPKLRGTGTTMSSATAELAVRIHAGAAEGDWQVTAARPVDVGKDILNLVGLSKDQFLQVILLAQNRFQQFLAASNDERQSVLRSLFGTDRFLAYETFLVDRRRELEQQLSGGSHALGQLADQLARLLELDDAPAHATAEWFEAGLGELEETQVLARAAAERADAAHRAADAEFRGLEELRARQLRRDAARLTLDRHLAQPVDVERGAVAAAARAAAVWPFVAGRRAADNELLAARALELEARAAYRVFADGETRDDAADVSVPATVSGSEPVSVSSVDEAIDTLTRLLGALDSAVAEEQTLSAMAAARDESRAELVALEEGGAEAASHLDALPALITGLQTALADTRVAAATESASVERVDRLMRAVAAAGEVIRLQGEVATAHAAETAASHALTAATAAHQGLMDRRFAGHAVELAAALVDDEPCAVCGSTTHPVPATTDAAPVTVDDIERARQELDVRRDALDRAGRVSTTLLGQLADATAHTDGRTLDALRGDLLEATAAADSARQAARRIPVLEGELADANSRLERAEREIANLQERRSIVTTALAEHEHALDAATRRREEQRAGFDSVAERVAALHLHLAAAKELERAIDTLAERQRALDSAIVGEAAALDEQGFESEKDAEAARLDPNDLRRLETLVREHEQAIATAQAALAEPELTDLPDDLVELGEARDAAADARAMRDAAMSAASVLQERLRGVEQVVTEARRRVESSASLRREFDQVRGLANALQGKEPNTRRMRLETYVLAARLEQIVAAANVRLRVMTSGRYTLEHDDSVQYRNTQSGLGLAILDEHTGRSRATNSLSGGETFLASLALALGLAEVVTNQAGGIRLDTLFIDEGFGSLDSDTLEIAMTTLDGLRAGGRTIGLISHVESMREQIPGTLAVSVTPQGDSVIGVPTLAVAAPGPAALV